MNFGWCIFLLIKDFDCTDLLNRFESEQNKTQNNLKQARALEVIVHIYFL